MAGAQTAGRGRLGRTWFSPPDAGLYLSTIVRRASLAPWITLAGGVAVAEGIRAATALPLQIKWPNDIVAVGGAGFRARRKIAGILAEASSGPEGVQSRRPRHRASTCGPRRFRRSWPDRAGSIETELGRPADAGAVLAQVLAALEPHARRPADGRSAAARRAVAGALAVGARRADRMGRGPRGRQRARPRGSPRTARCSPAPPAASRASSSGEVRWRIDRHAASHRRRQHERDHRGLRRRAPRAQLAPGRAARADRRRARHLRHAPLRADARADRVGPRHRRRVGRPAADAADGGDVRAVFLADGAGRRRDQRRHAGALYARRRRRRRSHRQRRGRVGEVRPRRGASRSSSSTSARGRRSTSSRRRASISAG